MPAFPGSLFGSMTNCLLKNFVVNVKFRRDADLVEREIDQLQDLCY